MKLTALLLFFFSTVSVTLSDRARRSGYTCRNQASLTLADCMENPRIRISKTGSSYNLRICTNDDCTSAQRETNLNWIRCNDIRSACRTLLGTSEALCTDNQRSEDEVDAYLNSFCASNVTSLATEATVTDAIAIAIAPSQCTTTTTTMTVTPSCSNNVLLTSDDVIIPASSMESGVPVTSTANNAPVLVLGALLSLALVLLAVVSIGLVWSCWTIKKGKREKKGMATASTNEEDDEEERYFKNPTYEGSAGSPTAAPVVTYDTVNCNYQTIPDNGHTYDVPDKEHRKGHKSATVTVSDVSMSHNSGSETNGQLNSERNYYQINNNFQDAD